MKKILFLLLFMGISTQTVFSTGNNWDYYYTMEEGNKYLNECNYEEAAKKYIESLDLNFENHDLKEFLESTGFSDFIQIKKYSLKKQISIEEIAEMEQEIINSIKERLEQKFPNPSE